MKYKKIIILLLVIIVVYYQRGNIIRALQAHTAKSRIEKYFHKQEGKTKKQP